MQAATMDTPSRAAAAANRGAEKYLSFHVGPEEFALGVLSVREIMGKAEKPYAGLRVGVKNGGCAGQEYVLEYAETAGALEIVPCAFYRE